MDITILYQDEDLLVIDKPFGIVVNRAETVKEETIQDWAEKELRTQNLNPKTDINSDFYNRAGIVHRLDKETSGCLIIAKTEKAFYALQAGFKERLVKKEYQALAHGQLVPKMGEINAPVGRLPWNRERFGVVPGGKEAHTAYEVMCFYENAEGEKYSFLKLNPTTGRTHQIRVHLKYLGFPIVGDYLYAGRKQQDRDRIWCQRVFLHAAAISFPHPSKDEMISVSSPLPPDLQLVLKGLRILE